MKQCHLSRKNGESEAETASVDFTPLDPPDLPEGGPSARPSQYFRAATPAKTPMPASVTGIVKISSPQFYERSRCTSQNYGLVRQGTMHAPRCFSQKKPVQGRSQTSHATLTMIRGQGSGQATFSGIIGKTGARGVTGGSPSLLCTFLRACFRQHRCNAHYWLGSGPSSARASLPLS